MWDYQRWVPNEAGEVDPCVEREEFRVRPRIGEYNLVLGLQGELLLPNLLEEVVVFDALYQVVLLGFKHLI